MAVTFSYHMVIWWVRREMDENIVSVPCAVESGMWCLGVSLSHGILYLCIGVTRYDVFTWVVAVESGRCGEFDSRMMFVCIFVTRFLIFMYRCHAVWRIYVSCLRARPWSGFYDLQNPEITCSGRGQSNRKSLLWRGTELNSKIIAHQKCFGREQKALDPKFNTSRSYSVIFSILHAKGKLCVDDPFPVGLQIGIMIDNLSKQQLAVICIVPVVQNVLMPHLIDGNWWRERLGIRNIIRTLKPRKSREQERTFKANSSLHPYVRIPLTLSLWYWSLTIILYISWLTVMALAPNKTKWHKLI